MGSGVYSLILLFLPCPETGFEGCVVVVVGCFIPASVVAAACNLWYPFFFKEGVGERVELPFAKNENGSLVTLEEP